MTKEEFLEKLLGYMRKFLPNSNVHRDGLKLFVNFVLVHDFDEDDIKEVLGMMEDNNDIIFDQETLIQEIAKRWVEIAKQKGVIKDAKP